MFLPFKASVLLVLLVRHLVKRGQLQSLQAVQRVIRISRHPQAIGQILWCLTHGLWIGSSFMLVTCMGLILHHLFAVWHGDRRLQAKFGDDFEELRRTTSVFPFLAVMDGRQKLQWNEFLRPSQLGICIAISVFWWAHRFISLASEAFL